MPNQQNFNSNLEGAISSSDRFVSSRIINEPNDLILLETVNSAFGSNPTDYIELHLYTIPTNALVLSTTISPNDKFVSSHIVSYRDNTLKNYLRIEFTELFKEKRLIVVPGDYYMVMNFFAEEIGNYQTRRLKIDRISSDRTEVEISFVNNTTDVFDINKKDMKEFVLPSFTKGSMISFTNEVLSQTDTTLTALEKLSAQTVLQNDYLVPTYDADIDLPNTELSRTSDRINKLNVRTALSDAITNTFKILAETAVQQIIDNGDARIQKDEFDQYLREAIRLHIGKIQTLKGMGLLIT